ncbi:MAG TPA: 4-carboxy-4-hydroxy-2-oxoadipate aldolase/oxaloacetate decarboxylase [Firmicutes bacterium]|nr:4-carboxy-4-hydroxy-2-oxoadipate aldolase/oxaloacetate decarboxylase [Bacillota bacterium]
MSGRVRGKIGFRFVEDIVRPPKEVVEGLGALPISNIADVMNRFRVMDPAIKPLSPGTRVAGPAVTVMVRPADNLMLHKAIDLAKPGDVIVVDTGGNVNNAVWGELMTLAALKKGIAGLIVDGAVRDAEEDRRLGFPIFARAVTGRGGDKDGPGEVNFPISCGGVVVEPGDIVIGDDDGVVVVPSGNAEEVLNMARSKMALEVKRKEAIANGVIIPPWVDNVLKEKGIMD